jgi:hypothetical protein
MAALHLIFYLAVRCPESANERDELLFYHVADEHGRLAVSVALTTGDEKKSASRLHHVEVDALFPVRRYSCLQLTRVSNVDR